MPSLLETTLSMYRTAFKLLRSVGFFRLPIQYQEMASTEMQSFSRLPTDVVPHHYDITLSLNLKSFIFNGNESVHVNVKKATDTIVINSLDIDIKNALFICNDGNTIATKKVDISTPKETATLIFDDKLPVGRTGYLSLEFEGEINDKMKGLYRSKYIGQDGSVKYAAVTQFEATDARCCFPCWDEPAHKATFDITLKVPSGLTALSNMPVKSKVTNDATETIAFETTPIMSTYLVAVVVGEFDYIEDTSSDGVLVRVYTPKSKTEQGQFALETAVKVLPYYKDYFGISYPLPKIDLIAIADFSSGAMENWGLVTYRETCLLVDPQNTSAFRKQRIALVVAHELAHQWFGNLVTMEWWTHLWLNEGYASFVEFLCVAHLYPEYGIWTQFVTSELIGALELDALQNSHAIEVPVDHPSEINEIFDEISYSKGACVIRMLHRYIGDDDFRKGMNLYLNRHSYGNARTADLWHALEDVSDKNVGKVMSMWTEQQGFPVVRVRHRQDGNDRILTLTQERFLASGDWQLNELWMIPISVSTSKNPDKCVLTDLLDEKTKEFRIKDVSPDSWVIVNPGKVGFYRTYYSQDALALLLPAVKDRTLPPLDRLSLFDDMFAVAQTGRVSTVEALQLLLAFQKEDNFTVWSSIVNVLRKIVFLLSHLESLDAFKAFGRNILRDICNELGWDPKPNESHCDTLLRSIVLNHMVGLNDTETIEEAKKRFELHLTRKAILPADLRRSVYRAVLSDGDKEAYQTILRLHREADLHEEKDRILRSLGAMKDEALLAEALEFAMSDEVRAQDAVYAIMSVSMSYKGRLMAWEFVKKHWQTLRDRYGGGFLMSRLVKVITENFVTEKQAQEVEQFFKEHSMLGIERTVQQCVESIRLNEEWLSRDLESIEEFLAKQQVK